MINRDETVNILKAAFALGKETFENAYKLLQTYWALVLASGKDPVLKFMNQDTNVRVPAILKATADENGVDTTGAGSNVSQAVKDSVNTAADNMDTSNRIQEQTTAVQKQVKESILSIAKNAAKKLVSQLKSSVGWFVKMATK